MIDAVIAVSYTHLVLHDHAFWLFDAADFEYVFERHRFEIQTIGRVVVGRNRLGVAIDHDRFVAVFAQGHGGMHATVVKLDALPDAIGTAAQNHDLPAIGEMCIRDSVNPLYTSHELGHQLADSGAKAIIIIENFAKTLQDVYKRQANVRTPATALFLLRFC